MMKYRLLAIVTASVAVSAQAQNVCESYQNQVVQPITIDAALTRLGGAAIAKGEFETTAQFKARQEATIGGSTGPLVISKTIDPQYIKYDADMQLFTIETYLFDNINMSYSALGYPGPIKTGLLENVDVVISEADTPAGTYEASNAFGAKATVVKIKRVTKGIWERPFPGFNNGLFNTGSSRSTLLKITLPPEQAAFIKPALRIAFLVTPISPYVVKGVGSVGKTTITRPIEVENELTVLVGDIQCAFLTDSGNKVLGSFPTN